jgi:O-antigen/teichoic acid export membrane protein
MSTTVDTPVGSAVGVSTTPCAAGPQPVARNAAFLAGAQVLGMPLSMLTNAITARYLGAAAFGYMYIGGTLNNFGALAVDWGALGALPALVATDRSRAGRLLGAALTWRLGASVIAYGIIMGSCWLLGYSTEIRIVTSLLFAGYTVSAITNAGQSVMSGFERVDVAAYRQVFEQGATLAIVTAILVLGGGLYLTLVGHFTATILALVFMAYVVNRSHIGQLSVDYASLRTLLRNGTPFVVIGAAMILQPTIDAAFLAKLAPADVVGWYSAARRLLGFLVFPVGSLVGSLYPTLCRLHLSEPAAFQETVRSALRATSVMVMPVALGCFLYPDIGIALFDPISFRPAEDNLRVLAVLLFLMYFTMPIGVSIAAAGRQRAWSIVQSLCIGVSLILDPVLIPWSQRRLGNGGLGLSVAATVSELIVLVCGVVLAPRGIVDRRFFRTLLPVGVSSIVMITVAGALRPISSFAAAPIAVGGFAVSLWLTGGIEPEVSAFVRRFVLRGIARLRPRGKATTADQSSAPAGP